MTLARLTDAVVGSLKDELISDIERCFADMETESLLVLITLVDPRFKDHLLRNDQI